MSTIWTIGHSTLSADAFTGLLEKNRIRALADVRRFPGSKRYPHFNREQLSLALEKAGIRYHHFPALGGRRDPVPGSENTAWRLKAFRGYADHMQTAEFRHAFAELEDLAKKMETAYMCSEAVWWSCHRALISDLLKSRGWTVLHIMGSKVQEHPYSSAARIVNGQLSYKEEGGLF
jgi:uncharacterized protein (DUF488 family)